MFKHCGGNMLKQQQQQQWTNIQGDESLRLTTYVPKFTPPLQGGETWLPALGKDWPVVGLYA